MLEIKFRSAGITPRSNVFGKLLNTIVYATKSSIFIITLEKRTAIILRDECCIITYLYAFEDNIAISDVKGNVEIYKIKLTDENINYELIMQYNFECIVNGAYIGNDYTCFAITMNTITVKKSTEIITQVDRESIPSCIVGFVLCNRNYIIVAYEDGKLECFEYRDNRLNLKHSIVAHKNGVRSLKTAVFESKFFIVTASLDNSLKTWNLYVDKGEVRLKLLDILCGHNDWVLGCEWDGINIISASSDNSIIIWKHGKNDKWVIENRFGGIREKNQTFFSAFRLNECWMAHSISGGIYCYENINNKLNKFCSGHTDEITSIDTKDDFLLTTSLDKTTRIYSIALMEEIGRPQIHGYGVQSAKFLHKPELEIVSGADETILRVYTATKLFIDNYSKIVNNDNTKTTEINKYLSDDCSMIAKQSELSLTNETSTDKYEEILLEGNTERNLSTNFLFTEKMKVYGHFFEICDVAICKRFIATANKSKNQAFSGIFIWDYSFNKLDYIKAHDLNIVKSNFSIDGKYLIAVSRDTNVSIYSLISDKYILKGIFTKHARIVNDCGFSFDNKYAFSVSRDKTIILYDIEKMEIEKCITLDDEITSMATHKMKHIIAVGFKTGQISLYKFDNEIFKHLNTLKIHAGLIKSLHFNDEGQLFTGGSDGLLNIIAINF